ncbi:MAG: hypothetical protein KDI68_07545 [Gammaproteobacteria bacterium]|nr:hypothetical protein [Gammaproteobacteria bacterium]
MDILLLLTHPEAGPIARGLALACQRAGIDWGLFVTNDGVKALADPDTARALAAATPAIVCQDSWNAHMQGGDCPLTLGSQTNNSALVAEAVRIVSL